MIRAEHPLAGLERLAEEGLGRAQVAVRLVVAADHGQGARGVGMIVAESTPLDRERALQHGLDAVGVALLQLKSRQVGQCPRGLDVVRPVVLFAHL